MTVQTSRLSVRARPRTRAVSRQTRKRRWIGLLFLSPALLLYGAIVLVPLIQTVNYSFYKWDGVSEPTWMGLQNYLEFGRDPRMYAALGHVLVLIVMFGLIPLGLGLISAALLSRAKIRGEGIYRWFLFLPQVLTSVVVAIIWKRIYAPEGPLNTVLRWVGLDSLTRNWLGDFTWALPSLGMIGVWGGFGFTMVLFLAAFSPFRTSSMRRRGWTDRHGGRSSGSSRCPASVDKWRSP